MVEQFISFIHNEKLFHSSQRVLLAVSGGADSMLMLHFFRTAGFSFGVAHCNFNLRGHESDADEQFVADYCDRYNLQYFVRRFDTEEFALSNRISIEMAARDLRYDWFNQLLKLHQFDYLATAHHQDDAIETFLINLSRGSGIKGLSGIQVKSGNVIRPMLFTNRDDILSYCARFKVDFRTDSSNSELVFKRNLIRNRIIPLLEEVNPAFRKNALKTIINLNETGQLFQQRITEIKALVYSEDKQGAMIHIEKLSGLSPVKTILFELIREFGFKPEQLDDIVQSLTKESGRQFYSETHRLVKDRDFLLISGLKPSEDRIYYIEANCESIQRPVSLSFEQIDRSPEFRYSSNPNVADLDADKLEFPLILRHWHEGEYFQPLGMSGLKKLSDFFIDEKYAIPEKENAWILASGNQLVWLVGKRIDDRYKISAQTRKIIRIRYQLKER